MVADVVLLTNVAILCPVEFVFDGTISPNKPMLLSNKLSELTKDD